MDETTADAIWFTVQDIREADRTRDNARGIEAVLRLTNLLYGE